MALVECYECGAHISDQVSACPHCGAPIDCGNNEENNEEEFDYSYPSPLQRLLLNHLSYREKAELLAKVLHIIFVIQLIVTIIGLIVLVFVEEFDDDAVVITLVGIPTAYVTYVILELCLGFYAMFVDACKDVRKLRKIAEGKKNDYED